MDNVFLCIYIDVYHMNNDKATVKKKILLKKKFENSLLQNKNITVYD